jgi:hypothetical protein
LFERWIGRILCGRVLYEGDGIDADWDEILEYKGD